MNRPHTLPTLGLGCDVYSKVTPMGHLFLENLCMYHGSYQNQTWVPPGYSGVKSCMVG